MSLTSSEKVRSESYVKNFRRLYYAFGAFAMKSVFLLFLEFVQWHLRWRNAQWILLEQLLRTPSCTGPLSS